MTISERAPTGRRKERPVLDTLVALPWLPILLLMPIVIGGLGGSLLFPHDPTAINLLTPRLPPAWLEGGRAEYLLGTDQFGRDLLSRMIEGARITLIVALAGVVTAGALGVTAGMFAGYMGGWVDEVIMRFVDLKLSIPAILLVILIGSALGGGLLTVILSIILVFWADYARVIRGETLTLRDRNFVVFARTAGCSSLSTIWRHILPNVAPTFIVLMTLQLGRALIIEASITFIGLGIQPPASAWGLLIAEGRQYLATAWWISTFSGLAITASVLGVNLLGDWLRDRLDPKLRNL